MDHKLNIEDLQESLQTSFICKKHDSSEKYRSKFLINSGQFSAGNIQKVICDILDELRGCESFDISVAFIVNFQRFPTLDAKKLVNAPKMSAHHRGICHF